MSVDSLMPHIDLTNTFGATLIGALIGATLYGLTSLQTYLFYVNYPDDTRNTKALVGFMWILDTAHTALMAYSVYFYLVLSYFDIASLEMGHWTLYLSVAFNHVVASLVQLFFLARIYILCPLKYRRIVTSVIGLSIFAHVAFGVETVVLEFTRGRKLASLTKFRFVAAIPFGISTVLSDVMITAVLCYVLHGSRSGFKRTDTIISTLIVYAINRCILTSIFAIVELILACTMPNTLWYLAVDFFVGKLYANSLLASLNSRASLRTTHDRAADTIHLSDLEFGSLPHEIDATKTKL